MLPRAMSRAGGSVRLRQDDTGDAGLSSRASRRPRRGRLFDWAGIARVGPPAAGAAAVFRSGRGHARRRPDRGVTIQGDGRQGRDARRSTAKLAKRAKKDQSTAKTAKRAKKDQSTAKTAKPAKKNQSTAKTAKPAKKKQTAKKDPKARKEKQIDHKNPKAR